MVAPALSMVETRGIVDDDPTYRITGLVSFLGIF
jgi:hypothetical protein